MFNGNMTCKRFKLGQVTCKKTKTTKLKNLYKGNSDLLCQTAQTHGEFINFLRFQQFEMSTLAIMATQMSTLQHAAHSIT